jgi:hypothetical protein
VLGAEGMNDSQGVPSAFTEARARHRERVALREEARWLAVDPEDLAELAVLRDELDEITPLWPAD